MIVPCEKCGMHFDDEFRDTGCPHDTFSANDGENNFAHHPDSYLGGDPNAVVSHNVVTPLFLIWMRNFKDPTKPHAQLHYGDPDENMMQYGGWVEGNSHRRLKGGKLKVEWEHRHQGIEALMTLYPYKGDTSA